MKRYIFISLIFILVVSFFGSMQSAQASTSTWRTLDPAAQKIDQKLQLELKNIKQDDVITVIVTLRQQADLKHVGGKDKKEKQKAVLRALKDTADAKQGKLKKLLDDRKKTGLVEKYTSLWVINGISVTASASVIDELAGHPDVLTITPDDIQISPALGTPEPNIALVNAPALWSQGYVGQGVVVASMDSGVDVSHPDLAARWRGGTNSWFDPYGQHPTTPTDLTGHGTGTTGIMVAGDAGGTSLGVAPGAQWIAVKIFNDQGGSTATAVHQGFQWLLDPDGNPNTDDAPQVVNNSWTFAYPGCNLEFELDLQSLRAAGILPLFAAGNGGPNGNTSYSPANNPSAFAVGATNNSDQIYALSSRGPSTCGGSVGPFPEIVAPGMNINTTDLGGFYYTDSGTSFAAPHVAGGLALLLSAYSGLDAGTQEQALINTAVDLGASGPDDVFGYGRLDLLAAFDWLAPSPSVSAPISPSGTLTSWDSTFTWTGLTNATWYLLEVQDFWGTQVFRKWYTSAETGCIGGTDCTITPTNLSLPNGDYKWRILDYGAYGYGANSVFLNFSLNLSCYALTISINPSVSGTVNVPVQNCAGGYIAGSVLQLTAVPATGYAFTGWSGDAGGAANPISLIMDDNKNITANLRGNTPISPSGTLTSWDKSFTWTGLNDATWYLIEVQTSGGTQVFRYWYTSAQTSCSGGTACSITVAELSLLNGDYKWRVMDYGAYGYGINSAFKPFTLDLTIACHTLTINLNPTGSGTVNPTAQNCPGGYTTGTVVQLTAAPNTGYLFNNWGGDASSAANPLSIGMDGNKIVTANLKAVTVLISPFGTLNTWDNTFTWTGLSNATWYLLEVYTSGGTQVFRKWYTSPQTGCTGGTACSIPPPETASLANGDYKWRILDYGAYGYGTWAPYMNFTLNQ